MNKIIITDSSTIYSALQKLQDSSGTCLIVTDYKKRVGKPEEVHKIVETETLR